MLQSRIVVDLPSAETRRRMGPIEFVRSLFGETIDLRSGKEELTVSAFSLLHGIYDALSRAGVKDAISLLVDKKVVYLDRDEAADDFGLVVEAAESKGVLDRKFAEMHLVLSHREAGLHTLIDLRVAGQASLGQAEMQLDLSSRVEDLQVRPGETAAAYAERYR